MTDVTRRAFVAGATAAAVGAAAVATGGSAQARPSEPRTPRIRTTRQNHRVVVIGAGFGGAVTALRLAQAGVPVTVLERGRWWPTGPNADTFATAQYPDKRFLWYRSAPQVFGQPVAFDPYVGLLDAVVSPTMTAICAAGVGGGSLAYQGMTLQPSEAVFNTVLPEALDYATMDRVHFPRVARMLQLATAPDSLIANNNYLAARVFAKRVRAAGYNLEKIALPLDWSYAQRELSGELNPSYTNGNTAFGTNNGGKHTVDVTYVKQAQETGRVTVEALHEVTEVAKTKDGRWRVEVNRINTRGEVQEKKILTTNALVMAAGSMGTTRLLLRAGAKGLIPDLPDGLGEGWGNNGDRIVGWVDPDVDFGATQGGPVVYDSKEWDDPATANTIIQAAIPALRGVDLRSTLLVGYGVSTARGRFVYDSRSDDAHLVWGREADHVLQRRIAERMRRIVGPRAILADSNLAVPTTWHPLGGAAMGSVVDLEGRVLGQRGLYVIDGAMIPGSTGACNPSMTIAAVAERALDNIVATDIGSVI